MKTDRISLVSWQYTTDESANFLDIDWPKVHDVVGTDQVKWLLSRDPRQCQLVLDKTGDDVKLVAEFYDRVCLTEYHLMWAK